jgi:phosphohistidine phosphatase
MELYMIRHGIAEEPENFVNDSERPLTELGISKTTKVAQKLYDLGVRFDRILTSPYIRAKETAEILKKAKLTEKIEISELLTPEGNFEDWLKWLQQRSDRSISIVGHQPNLGDWAEILIWGKPRCKLILKKAGIIGILLPEQNPVGESELFWLTSPKYLV